MIGQSFRQYRILEQIGVGGMGVVYKALDTKLDRLVALKFFSDSGGDRDTYRHRLEMEARAASRLDHPNIATVYSFEEVDGKCFICMAFVDGESLRDRIDRGPIPPLDAIRIARQVAQGLEAAHRVGIVHLDIKPSNILLNKDGNTRIADFGLARAVIPSAQPLFPTSYASAPYMSPEQAWGGQVDERSDEYSLGVVLYEMLSGALPFNSDQPEVLLNAILNEPCPDLALPRDMPARQLNAIVGKCLSKRPEDRYAKMEELADELRSIEHRSTRSKRVWLRWAAALLTLSVLVVLGFKSPGWYRVHVPAAQQQSPAKLIFLHPFANLGPDTKQYFAHALSRELRDRLASLPGLAVTLWEPSTSDSTNKRSIVAPDGDGTYDLTGTIQWRGIGANEQFRVSLSLSETNSDLPVWSQSFDLIPSEIFWFYGQVRHGMATFFDLPHAPLGSTLGREDVEFGPEAYDYFFRALAYIDRGVSRENSWAAINLLEKAIEKDSSFAPAMAYYAIVSAQLRYFGHDTSSERLSIAFQVSDRALALDSNLSIAHMARGTLLNWFGHDKIQALHERRRAVELDPSNAHTQQTLALSLRGLGRWADAVKHFLKAAELHPFWAVPAASLGSAYMMHRDYKAAEYWFNEAITREPTYTMAYLYKARLYVMWDGNTIRARRTLLSIPTQSDRELVSLMEYWLLRLEHLHDDALAMLPSLRMTTDVGFLERADDQEYLYGADRAQYGSWLPYYDSARALLEQQCGEHPDSADLWARLGVAYAGLRDTANAIECGQRAKQLEPITVPVLDLSSQAYLMARIYTKLGMYDKALGELERLLQYPSYCSPALLRIDPSFGSISQAGFKAEFEHILNHSPTVLPVTNHSGDAPLP